MCEVSLTPIDSAMLAAPWPPRQYQMLLPLFRYLCSVRMLLWMRHCCYQSWSLGTAGCLCTSQAAGEHTRLSHAVTLDMVADPYCWIAHALLAEACESTRKNCRNCSAAIGTCGVAATMTLISCTEPWKGKTHSTSM